LDDQVSINFIPNANKELSQNILTVDNVLSPGILFVAFNVDNVTAAEEYLKDLGVLTVRDCDLLNCGWGIDPSKLCQYAPNKSIFIRDEDLNILRLVQDEE
jgi:hypothetical protein